MKKTVLLFHNPGAGLGEHNFQTLVSAIEAAGHTCFYTSVKEKGWETIPPGIDWIAVAGGDGTIKRIVQLMGSRKTETKLPIGLLPMGTANNIAATLGITGKPADLINSWGKNLTSFDTGRIKWGKKELVFGEGVGFGLFPAHMNDPKKIALPNPTLEEKLTHDRERLLKQAKSYKPVYHEVEIDGKKYGDEYLMVEILNIRSIGPNMTLAHKAETGDGFFEVVLLTEKDRDTIIEYLTGKINGFERRIESETILAKQVVVNSSDKHFHIDDELVAHPRQVPITITLDPNPLRFFT